jgi:hypothetical protein
MENEETKVVTPPAKSGMSTYIITAVIGLVVLSFLVEVYGAFNEGRPLNLEMINKLLDTLTGLLGPPPNAD